MWASRGFEGETLSDLQKRIAKYYSSFTLNANDLPYVVNIHDDGSETELNEMEIRDFVDNVNNLIEGERMYAY